jgi:hypothetical protein
VLVVAEIFVAAAAAVTAEIVAVMTVMMMMMLLEDFPFNNNKMNVNENGPQTCEILFFWSHSRTSRFFFFFLDFSFLYYVFVVRASCTSW